MVDLINRQDVLNILIPKLNNTKKGSKKYQELNSIVVSIMNLPITKC